MIKVLLVVCNNVLNGTERYVVDLAKHLPKEQFQVYIATPIKGPLSEIISQNNIRELVYDNERLMYYSFRGLINLYRIIRKNKFDIVHANAKFYPCILGKLAGVKFNIETKHGIFYSNSQLKNLPLWRKMYEHFKQYFVDCFIAISENDKLTLIKYFGIKERKIKVINLGIDFKYLEESIKSVSKKPILPANKEIVIGSIGRMSFQKAQEYLLEAFKMLCGKYTNLKLILVGKGENESKLIEFVNLNNLNEKVVFKGYIDRIYEEILSFDMHVLTSRFEGTPYVILEAMALGVPVITSEVGGTNNFFKNEFDILFTVPEDSISTMKAIDKLINDHKLRDTIVRNALDTVKKYTVMQMAENTARLYKLKYTE